jgi:DNA-binding CsgD family transcriptional regulator
VLCCRSRIRQTVFREAASWESADWFYYIGDRFIRSMFYEQTVDFRLEPLHSSNWKDAERYIANRMLSHRDIRIVHAESAEDNQEYWIKIDDALLWLEHIRLRELHELDPGCVQLLRDPDGNVFGFAVIIPIHEGTWSYLRSRPPSATFFAHLSPFEQQALRTARESPAGYFIQGIDVCDYADPYMRQAAGLTFIRHMLSAGFVVTTVPAIPFFHAIFQRLGFRKTRGVSHHDYRDRKPTPYFVLDIRGRKLLHYLDRMIASLESEPEDEDGRTRELRLLSRREREVAELVMRGRTNREIAVELYLSEATVKKHVFSIFRKLRVKNRVELINRFAESRW